MAFDRQLWQARFGMDPFSVQRTPSVNPMTGANVGRTFDPRSPLASLYPASAGPSGMAAASRNVNPAGVFVTPNEPNVGGAVVTPRPIPQANPYQAALARQLMATGASTAPVASPMEGIARALTGAVGGYFAGQANEAEQAREAATAERLGALMGLTPEQTQGLSPEQILGVGAVQGKQQAETWSPMSRDAKIDQGFDPEKPLLISSRGNIRDPLRSGVNVNVNDERQKTFADKMTEGDVKRLNAWYEDFDKLSTLKDELGVFGEQLDQFETGAFAEGRLALGRIARALGMDVDEEELGAGELMKAIQSRLAPAMRATGSGSSSDRDVALFLSSLPNLSNTPEGNRRIIDNFNRLYERKRAELRFMRAWAEEKGSLADVGTDEYNEALDSALPDAFDEDERAFLASESTPLEDDQEPPVKEFTDDEGTKWRWSPSQNSWLEVLPGED